MVSFWLRNAARVRENFPLPFHLDVKRNGPSAREKRNGTGARSKQNGTGLRTSKRTFRSKRNNEKAPAAWVCSVLFETGFFRSEFFPRDGWLAWSALRLVRLLRLFTGKKATSKLIRFQGYCYRMPGLIVASLFRLWRPGI